MKRWSPTRMVPSMDAVGTTEASPTKIRIPRTIAAKRISRRVEKRHDRHLPAKGPAALEALPLADVASAVIASAVIASAVGHCSEAPCSTATPFPTAVDD